MKQRIGGSFFTGMALSAASAHLAALEIAAYSESKLKELRESDASQSDSNKIKASKCIETTTKADLCEGTKGQTESRRQRLVLERG